jgi:hypothetical protein
VNRQVGEFEALSLLRDAASSEPGVPEEVVARLWSRVSCDVGALAVGQGIAAAAMPHWNLANVGGWLRIAASRFVIWSAPALVIGAAAGAVGHHALAQKTTQTVYVERGAAEVPSANIARLDEAERRQSERVPPERAGTFAVSVDSLALEPEADSAREVRGSKNASSSAGPEYRVEGPLGRERAVLDPARAALAAGEPARALERANRHLREFPGGILSEEREAIAINALVRLGKFGQATRRATAFRARYPRSLLTHSVDAAVAAVPK